MNYSAPTALAAPTTTITPPEPKAKPTLPESTLSKLTDQFKNTIVTFERATKISSPNHTGMDQILIEAATECTNAYDALRHQILIEQPHFDAAKKLRGEHAKQVSDMRRLVPIKDMERIMDEWKLQHIEGYKSIFSIDDGVEPIVAPNVDGKLEHNKITPLARIAPATTTESMSR